jgi:hypothetical protein
MKPRATYYWRPPGRMKLIKNLSVEVVLCCPSYLLVLVVLRCCFSGAVSPLSEVCFSLYDGTLNVSVLS